MDGPGKKTKGWLVLGLECLGDCKADCVASGERERKEGWRDSKEREYVAAQEKGWQLMAVSAVYV